MTTTIRRWTRWWGTASMPHAVSRAACFDPDRLRRFESFAEMTGAELDDLTAAAVLRRIGPGEAVFRQGEPAHSFFVLLHGCLKVFRVDGEGRRILVRIVLPGELFGVARAIGRTDYPATPTAAVASEALAWPSRAWEPLVERHPALAAAAIRTVGRQLDDVHCRVQELATATVELRVACALDRLVRRAGRRVDNGVVIDFPITRQEIAELTGATIATVSRILAAWQRQGLLAGGRQRIIVRRPEDLARFADEAST